MKGLNFLFVVIVTTLLVGTLLFSEENTWKGPGIEGVAWRNGKVGIGTASPGFKFVTSTDVADWTAKILNTNSTAYGLSIENIHSTAGYGLAVYTGSGTGFFVRNNGCVGIGTAEPGFKFVTSTDIADWTAKILNTNSNAYGLSIENRNSTSGYGLAVYTGSGTGFFIRNNGNIGIGTPAPGAKLDVNGDIAVNGKRIIDSTGKWIGDPTGLKGVPGPQGPPGTCLWTDVKGSVTTSANVGIGTKPESTYKLQVSGGARIRDYLIIDADPKVYKPGSTLKLRVNGDISAKGKVFASCGTLTCSDVRYKKNLNPIENALDRVIQLRGVSFSWKDESMGKGQQLGVIGQEVEKVFPEVVSTDSDGYKSVAYSQLVAPLIEAIKELKTENETLKVRIEALESKLKDF